MTSTLVVGWIGALLASVACQDVQSVQVSESPAPPKVPALTEKVIVDGGLTAPSIGVSVHLPLQNGPDPSVWIDMAAEVGLDVTTLNFTDRVVARARQLRSDLVVKRQRAAQAKYDALNVARDEYPEGVAAEQLKPMVYKLIAWALEDSRRSVQTESDSWAKAVEEAAITTGQSDRLDRNAVARRASLMAREMLWSMMNRGPTPVPSTFAFDLERSLLRYDLLPGGPEAESEAAVHAYRQRATEALLRCAKGFEQFFRSSIETHQGSRSRFTADLCELFDLQISSVDAIAGTFGPAGNRWMCETLCRIHGNAAPLVRTHCSLVETHRVGLTDIECRLLDEVTEAARRASANSTLATRSRLKALFMGQEGHSQDPDADYANALRTELRALNTAIAGAMAALKGRGESSLNGKFPVGLRTAITPAVRELGSVDENLEWKPALVNPDWPGSVLATVDFAAPITSGRE